MPIRARLLSALTAIVLTTAAARAAEPLNSGIDRAGINPAVQPGDDFFQYANGTWIQQNPIPPAYPTWGAFNEVSERNRAILKEILDGLENSSDASLDPDSRKLRDFYATAMEETRLEHDAVTPLAPEFDRIQHIASREDLLAEIIHLHALGADPLLDIFVSIDQKHASRYALYFWQGGMGLPEKSYYFSDDENSKEIRRQYDQHITAMFTLLGDSPDLAAAHAKTVFALETQLAQASRTPVQLRDDEANYNLKTAAELATLAPNLNIPTLLHAMNVAADQPLVVGQPEFLAAASKLLDTLPLEDWKTYCRWRLIHTAAPFLSATFEKEDFHFYQQVMRGTREMLPRWKRAQMQIDRFLGEPLGRLYVARAFPPSAKDRIRQLVDNMRTAYRHRLQSCDWMSPETRATAIAKLEAIHLKLGYPDKWRDFSGLDIQPDSYVLNALRAAAFNEHFWLAKLGGPVDHSLWQMSPPTGNAYYEPTLNEIVFPAGILQPPFFQPDADDAVNYGSIGAIIGHEMTHGFDDQGSKYDANGNLHDWWTPADRARYTARTDKIVDEFNACIALDDLTVNGKLTLGENIADLGGLTIAYDAYHESLHGQPAPVIDGLTGDQRFFLGYAVSWRGVYRPAALRQLVRTNPHSPDEFRTNIPLSNFTPFYEAFHLTPENKMYRDPKDRAAVW
ncbi:MAG: M13 family metallopeptidase [Phycisphaerae bacterium]